MTLHRDHIAGGVFVVAGVFVVLLSNDLPFGTLASPGAGMLPMTVIATIIVFGAILIVQGAGSPRIAELSWKDLSHASRVVAVTAAATALYTWLGFILTMALMLFCLIYVVERRGIVPALAISVPVPLATYTLFEHVLKTPLERGLFAF